MRMPRRRGCSVDSDAPLGQQFKVDDREDDGRDDDRRQADAQRFQTCTPACLGVVVQRPTAGTATCILAWELRLAEGALGLCHPTHAARASVISTLVPSRLLPSLQLGLQRVTCASRARVHFTHLRGGRSVPRPARLIHGPEKLCAARSMASLLPRASMHHRRTNRDVAAGRPVGEGLSAAGDQLMHHSHSRTTPSAGHVPQSSCMESTQGPSELPRRNPE